ncbi:MAG: pyruvate kinase, partial [Actinomycetota bacterium]|nr:pyruvate kinase [Actinomycetota bacterium]
LAAGADVVRLNAAHGEADVHRERAQVARNEAAALGRTVGVLVDLPGPKLRTGPIAGEEVELMAGQQFTLTGDNIEGSDKRVSTTMPEISRWVRPGDDIYLADGAIVLRVDAVEGHDVRCTVVRGGLLRSRKGMHVPRAEHHVEPFTDTDEAALEWALALRAEFLGLSFVRRPEDVENVRAMLPKRGARPHLIAKIETAVALDHLAGIVAAADAVMVARGDLGIQVPARRVPFIQKEIIRFCNMAGKPVITATQMLETMTHSPLPTRAEVSDVANAVLDGTDALMLSEETAVGAYAVDAVRTMAEVAEAAEGWPRHRSAPAPGALDDDRVAWAVAHAAVQAAEDLGAAAILCPTRGGRTAQRVATFRPPMPIAGITADPHVRGWLTVVWGVQPLAIADDAGSGTEEQAVEAARVSGLVQTGDLVVLVFGAPGPRAGSTDHVRVVRV